MSTSFPHLDSGELDLLDKCPFSAVDHEILAPYEAVVDGQAVLIGGHCEIVLHSLEDLKCSAVRIANGEHTGRKQVADRLNISKYTVYLYIRQFKSGDFVGQKR